ncbi:MAG: hypothetical protein ACRDNZ_08450 [Streptosporangiaceae bacterium]
MRAAAGPRRRSWAASAGPRWLAGRAKATFGPLADLLRVIRRPRLRPQRGPAAVLVRQWTAEVVMRGPSDAFAHGLGQNLWIIHQAFLASLVGWGPSTVIVPGRRALVTATDGRPRGLGEQDFQRLAQ